MCVYCVIAEKHGMFLAPLTCAGPFVIIQCVSFPAVTVEAIKDAGTPMLTAMISK